MNKPNVKIIVLPDGTWSDTGTVLTITADAYEELCDGGIDINDLDDTEIVSSKPIDKT